MTTFAQPAIENQKSKINNNPTPSPIDSHLAFPLPVGELTLLIGNPGVGKSLLALDLALRASIGALYPPAPPTPFDTALLPDSIYETSTFNPGHILFLSAEDPSLYHHAVNCFGVPPERFIKPPPQDHLSLTPERSSSHWKNHTYEDHAPLIRWLYKQPHEEHLRLLILDPITHFLGPVNASASTLRQRLLPLLKCARDRNFAILGISHLTKSPRAADPVHLALGSLGFSCLARAVLMLTRDALHPQRRLLVPIKNNFAPLHAACAFTFRSRSGPPPSYNHPTPPELVWESEFITHHPWLRDATPSPEVMEKPDEEELIDEDVLLEQSQLALACHFLTTTLADGPVPSATLYKTAPSLGLSPRTIRRARQKLKLTSYQRDSKWLVALPLTDSPHWESP